MYASTPCVARPFRETTTDPDGQPTPGPGPLCPTDLKHATTDTAHLYDDYTDLGQLERTTSSGIGQIQARHRNHTPPIPIHLPADTIRQAIWHTTTTWAEVITDHQCLHPLPDHTRPDQALPHHALTSS